MIVERDSNWTVNPEKLRGFMFIKVDSIMGMNLHEGGIAENNTSHFLYQRKTSTHYKHKNKYTLQTYIFIKFNHFSLNSIIVQMWPRLTFAFLQLLSRGVEVLKLLLRAIVIFNCGNSTLHLPCRGHLAMSRDFFYCNKWEVADHFKQVKNRDVKSPIIYRTASHNKELFDLKRQQC